jgi:hypothetical protein
MKKQSGFVFITTLLSISLFVGVFATYLEYLERERLDSRARAAGFEFHGFNNGVLRYISDLGTVVPTGVQTGTAFLKSSTCAVAGLATDHYLPCDFPDNNTFGGTYSVNIQILGGLITGTTSVPWPRYVAANRGDLAIPMLMAAASGREQRDASVNPSLNGWVTYRNHASTTASQSIQASVSNAPSLDVHLRIDGSNDMQATLGMNNNDITGVDNLTVTGTSSLSDVEADTILINGTDINGNSIDAIGNLSLGVSGNPTIISLNGGDNQIVADGNGDVIITNPTAGEEIDLIADNVYDRVLNRYMRQGIFNVTVAKNGDRIPYPNCNAAGSTRVFTPQAFAVLQSVFANPVEAIYGIVINLIPDGSTNSWIVETILATETSTPAINFEDEVVVFTKCS